VHYFLMISARRSFADGIGELLLQLH